MRTLIRSLFMTISLLLWTSLCAQTWCAPNATWTYTYSNSWTTEGYARFMYTGDTVIAGQPSQRIDGYLEYDHYPLDTTYAFQDGPYFTSVNDGLVSIWDGAAFDTLFDFNSGPGEGWLGAMQDGAEPFVSHVVQDTGTLIVEGVPLHYLAMTGGDTIVERFGQLNAYLLPWTAFIVDMPGGPLRCYSDVDMDHTRWWWDFGCASWLTEEEVAPSPIMSLSPNPGDGELWIDGLTPSSTLRIFDATGRTCLERRTGMRREAVQTASWMPGVYVVRITEPGGYSSQARWVKE